MRVQEKNIKGFNILELLVVIVIISVVSAAAYPNFSSWRKERELRGAAEEIKNLFSNISSQVQRGLYAFVQVDVKEDAIDKTLTITSKGMRMDTLMVAARTTSWTTDMDIRCNPTQTWDDEGGPDNRKLEVAELIYDNVAINFSGSTLRGTVCFSKDGTYYSTAGALETDPFFYICRRSSTNTRCDVSDAGVPGEELDNVFAINWSRFGNITLEKWSKTKDDWVLQ
jgi:prepilin-type N-terminal cleavage/methylation domain-containing protein